MDDAKLTAYALGELDEAARCEVEARLAAEPALRAEVERIRAVATTLQRELATEELPAAKEVVITMPRQPRRWRDSLVAAILVVAICGVLVAILLPARSAARRSSPQVAQMAKEREQQHREHEQKLRDDAALTQRRIAQPAVTQPEAQGTGTIADLRNQSQRLISEQRYQEALTVLDEIVKRDPRNDYGLGLRPLVEDKALLQEQRRFREDFDRQFTKQLNQPEEKKVPYDDILRYPANWPDVTDGLSLTPPPPASPASPGPFTGSVGGIQSTGGNVAVTGSRASRTSPELVRGGVRTELTSGGRIESRYPDTDALGTGFKFKNTIEAERQVAADFLKSDRSFNTEAYDRVVDNAFLDVIQNPLSTFSIDVDTASYSNMRRFLTSGQRPPKDAVRIEGLINYFPYDYAAPKDDAKEPFAAHVEVASCPWQSEHRLVRVALKGREIAADRRPASNLVFLLDVSGSMNQPNKLPLVKQSMRMLLNELGGEDRVAIVVYAGHSGLVLPSTECTDNNKRSIENAIENLSAGGSTNGEQGIQLAYTIAKENFIEGGTNRVILCTDGDFNVGVTSQGDLTRTIEEKAKTGVFLSVMGFGMGNLKDSTMEKLADKGNGNYAYIDTIREAKKTLVEQLSGTLVTIVKDVKIQIEFNSAVVSAYRLIGYENRLLAKEDFNDDKKDAGEIGAGHAVTALYEIVPTGAASPTTTPKVDALKYQKPAALPRDADAREMLTLKLRYKQPDGDTSALIETPVTDDNKTFAHASTDFKFASAVAAFGMILRDSEHRGNATFDAVMEWAEDGLGKDPSGYRHEFLDLVKQAKPIVKR